MKLSNNKIMKKLLLKSIFIVIGLIQFESASFAQCNVNSSICTSGTAGPFGFVSPGTYVSTCLDWWGPNTGYILLNITSSGPLNMLINGNASSGFLDVAVFNIPNGVAPCTAIQNNANQIGCNYASSSSGCNQFGTSFPCGSSVPAPNVVAGQTLMIVVENWSGASSTFTMQLGATGAQTGSPNPTINPAGPFCSTGGNTQLTAVNQGGTWSGPGVSANGMFNPSTAGPGVHTINYSIGNAPCNAQGSTQITVNAPGNVLVNPTSASVCSGGSTTLNASGASNYTWSPATGLSATTGANVTASPASTTTYTVNASPSGCMTPASVTVTVGTAPNANAGATQVLTCLNTTATLNGSSTTPGVTYTWTGPGIVSGANTATPVVNAVGTYNLDVTNSAGCHGYATVQVTQNNTLPNANAGATQTIPCGGNSVNLNGSSSTPGVTYAWSGPGIMSGGSTSSPSVNLAGVYTLTVTNPTNGCTSTSTVSAIDNSNVPSATIAAPQVINCSTTSVLLYGSSNAANASFSWSGPGIVSGGGSATPTVNLPGTYTLSVTDPTSGCVNSSTANVIQDIALPNVNAGNDQQLTCTVLSVVLNGSSSTSNVIFAWSGPGIVSGASTATPLVNLAGTYNLTVVNPTNGCTSASSVNVTGNGTTPDADAGNSITLTCANPSLPLNGTSSTAGVNYSWNGPGVLSGSNSLNPMVNQPGVYVLTVTNPINGCSETDEVQVLLNNTPPMNLINDAPLIGCVPFSVSLNETTGLGNIYSWNFGDGSSGSGANVQHVYSALGCFDITLTVTDPSNGCTSTQMYNEVVCVADYPTANFTFTPSAIDPADPEINFNNISQDADTYMWSFGDAATSTDEHPTHNYLNPIESYTITLVASNGICSTSVEHVIQIIEPIIFYVPNAFTPDGDQFNQLFRPIITSGIETQNFSFEIYNRWGEMIWESHDASVGWDGNYGGNAAVEGVYTWAMKFKVKNFDDYREYKGNVNLIK